MNSTKILISGALLLCLAVTTPLWAPDLPPSIPSISTDGNIETDAQLVSNVESPTPPLAVSSSTMVSNFNADMVDGLDGTDLALDADLVALQAQVDALGLALVPRTGQTTCYDAAGAVTTCGTGIGLAQDGDLQLGVTWPNPRFTDNSDGTVTDNLTGLIWLENANCFSYQTWADALAEANALYDGCSDCGGTNNDCNLSDSSTEGQWRLPNVREMHSLVHYGFYDPAVPNAAGTGQWTEGDPFAGVVGSEYWSSDTDASFPTSAFYVHLYEGDITSDGKGSINYVWPVRGGQ